MKKENKTIIEVDKYIENIKNELNDIIKESTYPELIKYKKMLPGKNEGEKSLFYWGINYLNEYYKIIGKLDKNHTPEIEKLKYKIYILYLEENFYDIVFTFHEFITFSRLINATFSDYNPSKIRKEDKEPFQSENKEIDNFFDILNIFIDYIKEKNEYYKFECSERELSCSLIKSLVVEWGNKIKKIVKEQDAKLKISILLDELEKKIKESLEIENYDVSDYVQKKYESYFD